VIDTIGFLRKIVRYSSTLFLVFFLFPLGIFAQTSLTTDAVFSHNIKNNKTIESTVTLTITSDTRTVLTYYTVTIPQKDIDPQIYSLSKNKPLEATVYNRPNSTDILIDFENSVIAPNGSVKVTISYTHSYTDKNILNLPSKIADTPTSKVFITYPRDWGKASWISDQIEDMKVSDSSYTLTIKQPDLTNVRVILGENVIYSFEISRSLNNPTDESNQYEILLPPDTQFQRVIIEDINIQPTQAIKDNNNNYILIFTLDPQSQLDIKISGYILMGAYPFYKNNIGTKYNSTDIYWSLENRQIERMQEYLIEKGVKEDSSNEIIVQYIYKYIVENLTPSTSATTLAGGVRKGATEVLNSQSKASAEDYADVLRAFLSYYEIPSIYTIGYVSDISNYQENGMFHYWIQAYVDNTWIVLDPYLEDFSNVSLFNREQLDHITILNRIYDSISPTLTYYSNNDIKFKYISDPQIEYNPKSNVSISLEPYSILNKYIYGSITIENTGNTIFTGFELTDSQPNLNEYVDSVTISKNSILLPHMNSDINFHIPFNSIKDEIIYSTINVKNGTETVDSQLISTEYSIAQNTGYEVTIKVISFVLFVITFSIIYIVINKFIYKK
jgi:hypothetical protein